MSSPVCFWGSNMGITVVGLGPAGANLLTREAWETVSSSQTIYVRTMRHPVVAELPEEVAIISFDDYYDSSESFDEVYDRIVAELTQAARHQSIVYAVPGHPFVGESTVTALLAAAGSQDIPVRVVPGLSFVETVLAALGQDGLTGLQLFDAIEIAGYKYPPASSDRPLLLGQVYNQMLASELKLALMAIYPDQHPVFLVHAAGAADEQVEPLPLYAIDRSPHIGHLTALYVPPLPHRSTLQALAETVAILRGPGGCPWDQEQTPKSMRNGLLEEVSEVLQALDSADPESLCEELGDVFYHLVMQVQMAAEEGEFTLGDVISGIETKLRRRHPHVWGDWVAETSAEVLHNWEILKQEEKVEQSTSLLDGIPMALPALARSQKIQDRVRKVGFDWPDIQGVLAKLDEEVAELRAAASQEERQWELGDVCFLLANLASWLEVDAESALREANLRFSNRFDRLEALRIERGLKWQEMDLPMMDKLWEEVKQSLANPG